MRPSELTFSARWPLDGCPANRTHLGRNPGWVFFHTRKTRLPGLVYAGIHTGCRGTRGSPDSPALGPTEICVLRGFMAPEDTRFLFVFSAFFCSGGLLFVALFSFSFGVSYVCMYAYRGAAPPREASRGMVNRRGVGRFKVDSRAMLEG